VDLSRTWNLRIWLPQVATALGSSYAAMGRLADALPLLEEAVELASAMRLSSAQAPALSALAEARMLEGRLTASLEAAQSGLEVAQHTADAGTRLGRRGSWATSPCSSPTRRAPGTISAGPSRCRASSTCDR